MAMALTLLFWLLLALLILLVLAIALPLRVELRVSRDEALRYSLAFRPFGRFGPRFSLTGDGRNTDNEPKPPEKKKGTRRWGSRGHMVRAAPRLIGDLFACLRFETADVDMRFGTGDPAETGQIFGMLTPVLYGVSNLRKIDVRIRPVFDQAAFSGHAAMVISVVPAMLVPPFLRFGWASFGPGR